jgi:hypothetical protein
VEEISADPIALKLTNVVSLVVRWRKWASTYNTNVVIAPVFVVLVLVVVGVVAIVSPDLLFLPIELVDVSLFADQFSFSSANSKPPECRKPHMTSNSQQKEV